MLKAIFRTAGVFGTIFAAGYVAQRYFGWDAKGLWNQAKDKTKDQLNDMRSKTAPLTASLKDAAERKAM